MINFWCVNVFVYIFFKNVILYLEKNIKVNFKLKILFLSLKYRLLVNYLNFVFNEMKV